MSKNIPATSGAKKIGGAAPSKGATPEAKEGKEKKPKVKKSVFDIKNATVLGADGKVTSALNEDGELVAGMPIGFSFTTHKPLSKKVFGSTGHFLAHRAALLQHKGNNLVEQGKKLADKAEQYIKMGDDKNAKVIKKAEKAANSLAEISQLLIDSGMDVNAILAKAISDRKAKNAAAEAATK